MQDLSAAEPRAAISAVAGLDGSVRTSEIPSAGAYPRALYAASGPGFVCALHLLGLTVTIIAWAYRDVLPFVRFTVDRVAEVAR